MYFREQRDLFKEHQYQKGIDIERVVLDSNHNIDECLKCKDCNKLVVNPTICLDCKILFCERCGQNYQKNRCPKCKQKQLSDQVPDLYKIMLSKYQIFCKNADQGCTLILYYENLLEHEDNCHYEQLLCIFPDCFKRIQRVDYPQHIKNCSQRILKCKFCEKDFNYNNLKDHFINCEEKLVKCSGCKKKILNKYLSEHIKFCEDITLICERCKEEFNKNQIEEHTERKCVVGLIIKNKNFYEKQFMELEKQFEQIQAKIQEKEKQFQIKCFKCERIACEVALKKCRLCLKKLCTYCSKGSMLNCEKCQQTYCEHCLTNDNQKRICYQCCKGTDMPDQLKQIIKKEDFILKVENKNNQLLPKWITIMIMIKKMQVKMLLWIPLNTLQEKLLFCP